jgi:hypothetical protein
MIEVGDEVEKVGGYRWPGKVVVQQYVTLVAGRLMTGQSFAFTHNVVEEGWPPRLERMPS